MISPATVAAHTHLKTCRKKNTHYKFTAPREQQEETANGTEITLNPKE
jgi:hypothetical protein